MCGRYIEVQKVETIEKRFNVQAPPGLDYHPSYNILPGKMAPVITNDKPDQLQMFRFGLTPFWSKKPMYLFNARAEGDKNKENDPRYTGSKEIFRKPAFRKPLRSQRCLVVADAFIEGTIEEGLKRPFVVYLKHHQRPFAFAGIWDQWEDTGKGVVINSFSIITTVANDLIRKLPHHRSPVILPREAEKTWLSAQTPLHDLLDLLKPYPAEHMNAYPIDKKIKSPGSEGRELIEPIGERLEPESDFQVRKDLHLRGMGNPRKK